MERAVEPYEVGLEGVMFTLADVHEGHDEAFDRWYEGDHFYAGGTLVPFVLQGRRWYASEQQRAARYVGPRCPFEQPYRGTNLATYFLTVGGVAGFIDCITPQLGELRRRGRMFSERTSVHTQAYRFQHVLDVGEVPEIPAHVALDHPFASVLAVIGTEGEVPSEAPQVPAGSLPLLFERAEIQLDPTAVGYEQADMSPFDPLTLLMVFLRERLEARGAAVRRHIRSAAGAAGVEALWGGEFSPVVPGSSAHLTDLR